METIENYITTASTALQPYGQLISRAAMFFTIIQMLSPIFVFNNMRKAKSTLGMPFMMFLIILILTALSVRFSQLLNDEAMLKTNIVGFSITVIYVSIFFHFVSPDEKFNHLMKILVAAAFIGLMIIYSKVEDPEKVQTRFGFVLTAFIYSLMVMPVIEVKKALYEKCTRHMPFPMIVSGTLVGSCWFLHGIIINNGIVILQNSTMLGLNLVQLSMFVIYPSQPASDTKKEKRKKKAE